MKLKYTEYIPGKPYKTETTKKNEGNYKIKTEPTKKTTNINNPNIQNWRTEKRTQILNGKKMDNQK